MFNLLISADGTAWETDQLMRMGLERFQESSGHEAKSISVEKPQTLKKLEKIATLLMYEQGTDGPNTGFARYGKIFEIKVVDKELVFRFKEEGKIPMTVIRKYSGHIDLDSWEQNRTHWAVKDGHIPKTILTALENSSKSNNLIGCFIIMPFRPELKPVRDVVSQVVEQQSNGGAFRADDSFYPGTVIDQVKECIAKSDFCVADVSGANPNVLWEAGYAHALDKPIIQISQDTHNLPFDIRALRTLVYSLPALTESNQNPSSDTTFHNSLANAVKAVVSVLQQRPRIVGLPYDELRILATSLSRRSLYTRRHEPLLGIILKALQWDREHGPQHSWQRGDAGRLMQAIAKVSNKEAQDMFWWLIVYGVLAYDQIKTFWRGSDGYRDNLDLVHISERSTSLLNQLQNPIDAKVARY